MFWFVYRNQWMCHEIQEHLKQDTATAATRTTTICGVEITLSNKN